MKLKCSDDLFAAKLMYTLYNFCQAAVVNFLPIFFDQNFSKVEIGILLALPCACSLLSPPIWGAIADKLQQQRKVHVFCLVSGALLMYTLQFVSNFGLMCFMVIFANLQTAPNGSLLDQAVMQLLRRKGGEYGKQRLFGAVGYGLGAYCTGLAVAAAGISWAFNFHLIFALVSLGALFLIPAAEAQGQSHHLMASLKVLFWKKDLVILLAIVFLIGLVFGVISSFLTLNMYELSNQDSRIVGVAIACETSSELPAFFFADAIIAKLGIVKVLFLSLFGYFLRVTYYFLMVNPWTALPFEFLHGITFGLAWTACTKYVFEAAPKGTDGTAMGLLSAVQNGLGRGFGTLIGGYLYEGDGKMMWLYTEIGILLAFVGVCVFAYVKDDDLIEEESQSLMPTKPISIVDV